MKTTKTVFIALSCLFLSTACAQGVLDVKGMLEKLKRQMIISIRWQRRYYNFLLFNRILIF